MKIEKLFAVMLIFAGVTGLYFLKDEPPIIRLIASSLGMIWIIKIAALIWQKSEGLQLRSLQGTFIFLFMWPGVSAQGFTDRQDIPARTGLRFFEAWITFIAGSAILVVASLMGRGESTILNYMGLFSILLIVHLGLIEIIADGIRLLGFTPVSLFDQPYLASSLRDFWSVRWNRAFVDMNKIFIMGSLRNKVPHAFLTFSIFAISGVLHEMGISYADGVSWGFPLVYFIIQGIGMEIEKHRKLPRIIVLVWILLPIQLLFTPAFTNLFLGGLSRMISQILFSIELADLFRYGLILGGVFHLLVLGASVQVPEKLGWREEFQKLSSLNRKIFWTYGGYIFSIIIFMSVTSFILSQQDFQVLSLPTFLWILFIAFFWWARVLTDFFYMSHTDWPQGPLFSIGHTCLTTLFISMSVLYTSLAFVVYGVIK